MLWLTGFSKGGNTLKYVLCSLSSRKELGGVSWEGQWNREEAGGMGGWQPTHSLSPSPAPKTEPSYPSPLWKDAGV